MAIANDKFSDNWNAALDQLGHSPDFEVVEIGWEQHVLIDHKNGVVYRYPRREAAAQKLIDEVGVLQKLEEYTWPVEIPHILEQTTEFTSYTYIPGSVLTEADAALLPQGQIDQIARTLGEFFAVLHAADKTLVDIKSIKPEQSLLQYYQERIQSGVGSRYFDLAQRDLGALLDGPYPSEVVVHGDLHGPNMVLEPTAKQLIGVIDFSEVEVGDPHLDLRKPFMTDSRLLKPMVESYTEASGNILDEERIKLWAYVNEWANVCYFSEQTDNATYKRALAHLNKWQKV